MPIPTLSGPPALLNDATGQLRQPPAITATAQTAAGRLTARGVRVRGRRGGSLAPVPVPAAPGWIPATAAQAQRNLGTAASNALVPPTQPSYGSYGRMGAGGSRGEFSGAFANILGADPNSPGYTLPRR